MAGYRCVHAYDIDPAAVATYNHNIGADLATVADLGGDFLRSVTVRADVVIAGPPCQGFSTVGRRDPNDVRNHLLLKPVDLAIRLRAPVLLLENVRGALFGRHVRYWKRAIERLEHHGYRTVTLQVAAGAAGLPQIRRRAVLVAARRTFGPPPWISLDKARPLRSILDLPSGIDNHVRRFLDPSSRAGQIASRIGPGQKLSNVRNGPDSVHSWDIPDVFGHVSSQERAFLERLVLLRRRYRVRTLGDADPVPFATLQEYFGTATHTLLDSLLHKEYVRYCGANCYDLRRTFNGKFRRLHPDRPAHSVLTQFCDPRHFLHPWESRGFTVREAARLQGFPDTFRFLGSPQQQSTQIGNAVPPPLAAMLATWIREQLL